MQDPCSCILLQLRTQIECFFALSSFIIMKVNLCQFKDVLSSSHVVMHHAASTNILKFRWQLQKYFCWLLLHTFQNVLVGRVQVGHIIETQGKGLFGASHQVVCRRNSRMKASTILSGLQINSSATTLNSSLSIVLLIAGISIMLPDKFLSL